MPAALADLVAHCHQRLGLPGFPDFPGAHNGLQLENNGTIIAMGTPAGVGMGFKPPRFLKPGDTVTCEIEKIGKLENVIGK